MNFLHVKLFKPKEHSCKTTVSCSAVLAYQKLVQCLQSEKSCNGSLLQCLQTENSCNASLSHESCFQTLKRGSSKIREEDIYAEYGNKYVRVHAMSTQYTYRYYTYTICRRNKESRIQKESRPLQKHSFCFCTHGFSSRQQTTFLLPPHSNLTTACVTSTRDRATGDRCRPGTEPLVPDDSHVSKQFRG